MAQTNYLNFFRLYRSMTRSHHKSLSTVASKQSQGLKKTF